MKTMTCGFMFNEDYSEVLLINKNRPDWQNGKMNGIGGKIESDESPHECMIREFEEETGISDTTWIRLCELWNKDWMVYFFWTVGDIHSAKATTDEVPQVVQTNNLPDNVIENLHWLVHLAMDRNADGYNVRK